MNKENRINITSFARRLRSKEVLALSQGQDYPLKQSVKQSLSAEEWSEQYSVVKPELYALTAALSDRIVGRAYELRGERQPFGLVTYDPKEGLGYRVVKLQDLNERFPFMFTSIAMFLRDTLKISIDHEVAEIESGRSSPQLQSIYIRLENILGFLPRSEDYFLTGEKYKNVERFIEAGINTASTVMGGGL